MIEDQSVWEDKTKLTRKNKCLVGLKLDSGGGRGEHGGQDQDVCEQPPTLEPSSATEHSASVLPPDCKTLNNISTALPVYLPELL